MLRRRRQWHADLTLVDGSSNEHAQQLNKFSIGKLACIIYEGTGNRDDDDTGKERRRRSIVVVCTFILPCRHYQLKPDTSTSSV